MESLQVHNYMNQHPVTFTANNDIAISEALTVNSSITAAEAYTKDGSLLDVNLEFIGENGEAVADFTLYQNQPNPFKSETLIGFNLPTEGAATLKIYDVSGKILRLIEGDYAKGYNEVSINRSELAGSGVLYYTLETANDSATKKMIIIE